MLGTVPCPGYCGIYRNAEGRGRSWFQKKGFKIGCQSLDGRRVWERLDICICMSESFCCSETTTTLIIGYCCSVANSCLTLCDPVDCDLLGPSVRGVFQARILEWVAISFASKLAMSSTK